MKTILFVDDEPPILALAEFSLNAPDRTLLLARSSDEAIQASRQYRAPIHLLITDLKMDPFMSGAELAQCMRQLRPGIKVLYVSGYALEGEALREVQAGEALFLPKPFVPGQLRSLAEPMLEGEIKVEG